MDPIHSLLYLQWRALIRGCGLAKPLLLTGQFGYDHSIDNGGYQEVVLVRGEG